MMLYYLSDIKIKLNPSIKHKLILKETLDTCSKALNWISDKAWEKRCFNRVALNHLIYIAIVLKDKA